VLTTKPPTNKLAFNPDSAEWEVDGWIAACVVANKALVHIRRGKTFACGVFFNGAIREVSTGSTEKLSGPWVASSKGWQLCE